eukprot:7568939-Lingulodinium_polyedra.AAC.1
MRLRLRGVAPTGRVDGCAQHAQVAFLWQAVFAPDHASREDQVCAEVGSLPAQTFAFAAQAPRGQ